VTARIKYSEADSVKSKRRPALVISSFEHNGHRKDLVLLKISSRPVMDSRWEVAIASNKTTGLVTQSKVVCDHLETLSKDSVEKIGRIDSLTLARVRRKLSLLFGL
jgi:mRNA interferase MazF